LIYEPAVVDLYLAAANPSQNMSIKQPAIVAGAAILLVPALAHADAAGSTESSTWSNLLWGVLPFVILGLLFYWFLRRVQSSKNPRVKKYDEHMERQVQHMERVEQSLERIAKLLEKKD
jgi:protein-S-isoprenylcysteine O-methyltransferase Ste14